MNRKLWAALAVVINRVSCAPPPCDAWRVGGVARAGVDGSSGGAESALRPDAANAASTIRRCGSLAIGGTGWRRRHQPAIGRVIAIVARIRSGVVILAASHAAPIVPRSPVADDDLKPM